jgi:hypothetical protein
MVIKLTKKTKNILSNRVKAALGLLVLCALMLIPFFSHLPVIIIGEVFLITLIIGSLSGIISNGLLQVIFGYLLTIFAAGYISFNNPEYLRSLFAPMFITLLFSNGIGRSIAKKIFPYNNVRFQSIVSAIAVLILIVVSVSLPFYENTQTPVILIVAAIIFSLLAGYLFVKVFGDRKLKYRKPTLIAVIILMALVISIFTVRWPILLMVIMINIFNGVYINAIFRQSIVKIIS